MRMLEARVAVTLAALALACGEKPQQPAAPPPAAPPAPTAAPAPTPPTAPIAPAPPPPPEAPRASAPPASRPPAAAPPKAAPAAPEEPSAHAKVGADKCRMCHRVQHASWAASPHAAKGLDCEGCHGSGADYWPAAVMRDRARAQANGLVLPTLAPCKRCHGAKADAALLERVHAHKAR